MAVVQVTPEAAGLPRQTPQQSLLYGGGRAWHFEWPYRSASRAAGTSLAWDGRRTFSSGNELSGAILGVMPTYIVSNGVPCARFPVSGALPGTIMYVPNPVDIHMSQTAPYNAPQGAFDLSCWRAVTILAYVGPQADAGIDYGPEVYYPVDNTNQDALRIGLGAFGVTRDGPGGAVRFFVAPGGLFFNIPIAGFDPTMFHSYEFRVIGATGNAPAILKMLVDNVLIKQLSWGPGTQLPGYIPATRKGRYQLVNANVNGGQYDVYRITFSQARSEAELL